MLFGKPEPMVPGQILADPKEDYRSAQKIGPFRVSQQALYLPNGTYLLRSAILEITNDWGCAHVTGCCAGGIPVPRVVITTAEKKIPFLCDKEAIAKRLVEALTQE